MLSCRGVLFFARIRAAMLVAFCAVTVVPLVATAAQSSRSGATGGRRAQEHRDSELQRTDTIFAVQRGTALDVTATSAKITIVGWSRSEMEIRGGAGVAGLQFSTGARTVRVELRAGRRGHDDDGDVELRVPRGTRVLVNSQQGEVEIRDVGGAVDARVVSGDVTVRGSAERSDINVASGDVRVSDADGPVRVDAISGEIVLEDIRGNVDVSGTSAGLTMRRVQAVRVHAVLVSGTVSFDGPLADNGRYEFTTHAGDVKLYLGAGAKGSLEVQSFNGDLHTAIPLTTTGAEPRSDSRNGRSGRMRGAQRFEFGGSSGGEGGGAQIVISTFSGDVIIARAQRRSD